MKLITCLLFAVLSTSPLHAQGGHKGTWIDPNNDSIPVSFAVQGEYLVEVDAAGKKQKLGCQVIALGDGLLQAILLPGGLPGAGWDGENKMIMDGKLDAAGVGKFVPADGKKSYISKNSKEFSATRQFPPTGHKACSATITDGTLTGKTANGHAFELKKEQRKSMSLGAEPPAGATVLELLCFQGEHIDLVGGQGVPAE